MNNQDHQHASPEETGADGRKTVSRRQLLKAISAAGGAVAATTLLPNEWTPPIVETGALPIHAQASPAIIAGNLQKTFDSLNSCTTSGGTGSANTLTLNYNDPTGNFNAGSVAIYTSSLSTTIPAEIDLFNTPGIAVTGDAFQGTIAIPLCTRFGSNDTVTNQVQLRNSQGNLSNVITVTISRPPGAQKAGTDGGESLR